MNEKEWSASNFFKNEWNAYAVAERIISDVREDLQNAVRGAITMAFTNSEGDIILTDFGDVKDFADVVIDNFISKDLYVLEATANELDEIVAKLASEEEAVNIRS